MANTSVHARRPEPWRHRRRLVALGTTLIVAALPVLVTPSAGATEPVFRMTSDQIRESSGLVMSRHHGGLAYTVNDSGDGPIVYVLDRSNGRLVGKTRLDGTGAVDFEALGSGPRNGLLVADIGDNGDRRSSVRVHIMREPRAGRHVAHPRTVVLRYSDGPQDAEAILVRGRQLLVVTKGRIGTPVYAAPVWRKPYAASLTMHKVGEAPSGITDATVLDDGRAVLRTYSKAFVYRLSGWERLRDFDMPDQQQGESLAAAVRGTIVFAGSEGRDSPVYRVRVPDTS